MRLSQLQIADRALQCAALPLKDHINLPLSPNNYSPSKVPSPSSQSTQKCHQALSSSCSAQARTLAQVLPRLSHKQDTRSLSLHDLWNQASKKMGIIIFAPTLVTVNVYQESLRKLQRTQAFQASWSTMVRLPVPHIPSSKQCGQSGISPCDLISNHMRHSRTIQARQSNRPIRNARFRDSPSVPCNDCCQWNDAADSNASCH